jgi:hypothetical protein
MSRSARGTFQTLTGQHPDFERRPYIRSGVPYPLFLWPIN